MTKKELLNHLEKEAKNYHMEAVESVVRNRHMNNLGLNDLKRIRDNKTVFDRFSDAVIVDFINKIAMIQGLDLGLCTKHLKDDL